MVKQLECGQLVVLQKEMHTSAQAQAQLRLRSTPAEVLRMHRSPASTALRPCMFSMGMICGRRGGCNRRQQALCEIWQPPCMQGSLTRAQTGEASL